MFLFIFLSYFIGAVITFFLVIKNGTFKTRAYCQSCGALVKGTQQTILKPMKVVLCPCCAGKIHPRIIENAKEQWTYPDYINYLKWDAETKEERNQFNPDVVYGNRLALDTERGLLCLGGWKNGGLIFRFSDIQRYEIDFKPEDVNAFNTTVTGHEYITIQFSRPNIFIEDYLRQYVSLGLKQKGIISPNLEYTYTRELSDLILTFGTCYIVRNRVNDKENSYSSSNQNENVESDNSELNKALALFMFDSLAEITEEKLKHQRNILIKAFHPDNALTDDAYSQKINAAYSLLLRLIKAA